MKRKFVAFYDILIFTVTTSIMLPTALSLLIFGHPGDAQWRCQNWYLILIHAVCIAVPTTSVFCLQKMKIDLNCDKVKLFYLVNYAKNDLDLHSNWIIYPSEITKITVVRLSKEEKRQYTSAKFLFSKYLKIEMKYGHVKYVYVSHYSNRQIKKIVSLLTSKNS